MSYNIDRFAIAKDLKEWLETEKKPWGDRIWSDEANWKYDFQWDKKLLSFMNIYIQEIELFSKYYPDMDIFLQNIYWDPIFNSAQVIIEQVLKKIDTENNLIIIHASPLEMVVIGEFFKNNGIVNVTYNFNRIPAINSVSKTLEAGLFLVSWDQTLWLKEKIIDLWKKTFLQENLNKLEKSIVLLDENDIAPSWNISRIDPYVKSSIGWKENVVIYRVDEMPKSKFLLDQGIKDIYFFDTDSSNSIDIYYQSTLNTVFTFHNSIIDTVPIENIGFFEDYVIQKNYEYLQYKKEVLSKNEAIKKTLQEQWWGMEKWKWKSSSSSNNPEYSKQPISLKEWIAYLGWLAIILPLFLLVEARWGQGMFIKNTSGWWNYTPTGSSGFRSNSSSWGSTFSRSTSSSSSSSISSFGGGWFSKWGG